jgi:hypothetical protein
MRLLIELVIAAALLAMAWQKSFREWTGEVPVIGSHLTTPSQAPKSKPALPPATSATAPKSFTGHIFYTDEAGKSYWLDAQGKRHYQP